MTGQTQTVLQAVLESSPEVIVFALDREYRYLAFNERHREAIRGIWGQEIGLGMSMLDVISRSEDREKARAGFDRALAGHSFVVEDEYGATELERLYWQNFFAPIRDEEGAVIGLTVFVLNITERRRAERALALREQGFRNLVEHSGDHIARHDRQLRRTYVNPAFAAAVGGGERALLGRTPAQSPGGQNAAELEAAMAEVLRTGTPGEFELVWSNEQGDEVRTLVGLTAEIGSDGQVSGVLAVGRDVTRLRAAIA